MKVNIFVDTKIEEENLVMHVRRITDQVDQICRIAETDGSRDTIAVTKNDRQYILPIRLISHLIIENGKCMAFSGKEKYVYKESLKYFEEKVGSGNFVRISKYCLANISWMDYFEASFSGNLLLKLKNGWSETVSRKYVADLRNKLF